MGKLTGLAMSMSLMALPASAQIACPLALTDGHIERDTIKLSVRNKGKVPIEQFSLSCSPSPNHKSRSTVCHRQNGIFYPGTPYWIDFPYAGADAHEITISVSTAQLSGGSMWTTRSPDSCRPLRVVRKH